MSDKDKNDLLAWEPDEKGGVKLRSTQEQARISIKEILRREMPGTDLPVRGEFKQQVNVRDSDPPWMQYRVVHDARIDILELWQDDQLARYVDIMDAVAKGLALLSYEEREWVPEEKNWKVMIRWLVRVVEPPKQDMFM